MAFEVFIPMKPVAKGRPRFGRGGRVYTPDETAHAEAFLKGYLRVKYRGLLIEGPLAVSIVVHKERPKSQPKRVYPTSRPDLDNYIKLVMDAMNGLVFIDDAQVVKLDGEKKYSEEQGIFLRVTPLTEGA